MFKQYTVQRFSKDLEKIDDKSPYPPIWALGVAWGIEYTVSQCTDTPNFIFVIKQGGLGQTLEIYNSLLAELA